MVKRLIFKIPFIPGTFRIMVPLVNAEIHAGFERHFVIQGGQRAQNFHVDLRQRKARKLSLKRSSHGHETSIQRLPIYEIAYLFPCVPVYVFTNSSARSIRTTFSATICAATLSIISPPAPAAIATCRACSDM